MRISNHGSIDEPRRAPRPPVPCAESQAPDARLAPPERGSAVHPSLNLPPTTAPSARVPDEPDSIARKPNTQQAQGIRSNPIWAWCSSSSTACLLVPFRVLRRISLFLQGRVLHHHQFLSPDLAASPHSTLPTAGGKHRRLAPSQAWPASFLQTTSRLQRLPQPWPTRSPPSTMSLCWAQG